MAVSANRRIGWAAHRDGRVVLRVSLFAFVLLASALAHGSLAARADSAPVAMNSYIVVLNDQQSHAASTAVRAQFEPAINALAARRASLITTPDDLSRPDVLSLASGIAQGLADM